MGKIFIIPVLVLLCLNAAGQARVNFTSSNLPIIVIDIHDQEIVDDPKITADLGVIDHGPGQRNDVTDGFTGYEGKIGIELRGSTSQMFPKKPYGLELRDADGDGIDAVLLGMPKEEDWSLIATYNDKSLMRDALAYRLGRDLGRYAPRTRFCELVIKKDTTIEGNPTTTLGYKGIYMLTEKIKRDKYRVDINKLDPDEISGDNLTGGYILKIDKTTGDSGMGFDSKITSTGGKAIQFQYEEPAYDDIVPEQKTYIQQFIHDFEAALHGPDYKDADKGYAKYIDVDSFIDFLIVNEMSRNVDGYRLSTFMYKDKDSKGGKLVMGPVWDFNLGFGNANYCSGELTTGWAYNFNSVCQNDPLQIPFWWNRLLTDTAFQKRLTSRWTTLRSGKFSTASLHTYIDSLADVLDDEAAARNFQAWSVLDEWVWPNYYVGKTYQDEVDWLKEWVEDRAAWLDANMPRPQDPEPENPEPEEPEPPATVTAILPEDGLLRFSVSPNPFADELTVKYTLRKPGTWAITLIDPLGRRLSAVETKHDSPGAYEVALSPPGLTGGIYYVQATSAADGRRVVRKVIKR